MARTKHTARMSFGGPPPKRRLQTLPSAVLQAASTGNKGQVQKLAAGFAGPKALYNALKQLLNADADVLDAVAAGAGTSAQNAAAEVESGNRKAAVQLLLAVGASTPDEGGSTPLHVAASVWDADAVKLLLEAGASVTAAAKQGKTPLHLAASEGDTEAVELLLAAGASVAAVDEEGSTPLHAAARAGHAETIKVVLEAGASMTAADKQGKTPLHLAAEEGHAEAVKLLLAAGASVAAVDKQGDTPLYYAAWRGKAAAVELLLAAGASVAAVNEQGSTPLHAAAYGGHTEAVKLLLAAGASVAAVDERGSTPLHAAAYGGHTEAVKLLLAAGASVAAVDEQGRTLLHAAAREVHAETVELLLAAGASVAAVNDEGSISLHYAAWRGKAAAVELLLAAGASVTAAGEDGCTPLHDAVTCCSSHFVSQKLQERLVQELLKHGADACAAADAAGRTPLLLAAEKGRSSIVKVLLSASTLQAEHITAAQQAAEGAGHTYTAAVLTAALASPRRGEQAAQGSAAGGPSTQEVQPQPLQQQHQQQQQQEPQEPVAATGAAATAADSLTPDTAAAVAPDSSHGSPTQAAKRRSEQQLQQPSAKRQQRGQGIAGTERLTSQQDNELQRAEPPSSQQQQLAEPDTSGSVPDSRVSAVLAAIRAEGSAAPPSRTGQQQQMQQPEGATPVLGRAAARLLQDALAARQLPGLPNQQELQYFQLADVPFRAVELVALHNQFLVPDKTSRTTAGPGDTSSSGSSGRKTRKTKKVTLVEKHYPQLAPCLLQLRDAVPVFGQRGVSHIPASAVTQTPASTRLLLAQRCLRDWQARVHLPGQQEVPMLLRLLLLAGQHSDLRPGAAGVAGGDEDGVVECVDLVSSEGEEEEGPQQQQQLAEGGPGFVLTAVKQGPGGFDGARVKQEPL